MMSPTAPTSSLQGFLSLAEANFSNPNRLRYGQDFYDERMRALKVMYVLRMLTKKLA